jgi:hypothetical protein
MENGLLAAFLGSSSQEKLCCILGVFFKRDKKIIKFEKGSRMGKIRKMGTFRPLIGRKGTSRPPIGREVRKKFPGASSRIRKISYSRRGP